MKMTYSIFRSSIILLTKASESFEAVFKVVSIPMVGTICGVPPKFVIICANSDALRLAVTDPYLKTRQRHIHAFLTAK